mgnify:CR=1 FL=1
MEGVAKYEGYKLEKGSAAKVVDPLTIEQALQINLNGKPFTVVMQTPGDEEDLARGLLFAEDVLPLSANPEVELIRNKNGLVEKINLAISETEIGDGYLNQRSLLSVSSCGICGKQSLDDLPSPTNETPIKKTTTSWSTADLFKLQEKAFARQSNFQTTGGCHGAALFNKAGDILALKEDIGRHNAVDKLVGNLIRNNNLKEASVLIFSGRVSYEIVAKCFRAKIPIIMAVSAPSTLAIDFAKEYGITLLAFSRKGKTTCYANCNRISP